MPMLDTYNPETPAFEPHLATVYSAVFSSVRANAVEGIEFQNDGPRFHLLLHSGTGRSLLRFQLGRNCFSVGFVFVCDWSKI
jgi:hypothetical protein